MPPPRGCRVCWSMQTILWIAVVLCPTVWHLAVALESLSAECRQENFSLSSIGKGAIQRCACSDCAVLQRV